MQLWAKNTKAVWLIDVLSNKNYTEFYWFLMHYLKNYTGLSPKKAR